MSEMNWIEESKEHFEKNGGLDYSEKPEIAEKSKKINKRLQQLLDDKLQDDGEVSLNKQGSKWSIQGQKKLQNGIWYRAYHHNYGNAYPIVFGVYIGKKGLNIAIQIYNNLLNDNSLSKVLGEFIFNAVENEGLKQQDRGNKNEEYSDFGFFNISLTEEIDKKFEKVLSVYKKILMIVNNHIFDKMVELFNQSTTSKHCKISEHDEHYTKRKNVKNLVNIFIETENKTPTEEQFKEFWNMQTINSAQQASNATNIINRNESSEDLQSNVRKLINLQSNVRKLVNLQANLDDDSNLVIEIQNQIDSSKKSSLELYYYYHMETDGFPLINGGIENAVKIIEKNTTKIPRNTPDVIDKLVVLKEKMKGDSLEKFYLLDQFLNLIDKIKYDDIKNEKSINKELYQLAYLFTFFRKAKLVSNSSFFDNLLQKSKNIILYGAPGTGKTYTSEMNISRIIEEDYLNEDIDIHDRYQKVQFHPSYSYEDFMEGLKPIVKNQQITLELQKGDFMQFCEKASEFEDSYKAAPEEKKMQYAFFFLVDEINRAELSRVFGEIMYALDKRGNSIQTQYSYMKDENKYFSIPHNVYFIGTMNDVDRSIDSFDIALRRRFFWYRMDCDYSVIQSELLEFKNIGVFNNKDIPENGYLKSCYELNQFITQKKNTNLGLGKLYQLGHDYFMKIKQHTDSNDIKNKHLDSLFNFSIEPLLKEYIRAEYSEDVIEDKINEARKIFQLR